MTQCRFRRFASRAFVGAVSAILLLTTPTLAAQRPRQSLESIEKTAREFVKSHFGNLQHVQVEGETLDTRLRLSACAKALEAFWPPGAAKQGNTSVGVRCTDNHPWSLYVPLRIAVYKQVWVSSRPLQRGELVEAQDLRLELRNVATLMQGYTLDKAVLQGHKLKRTTREGQVLTPRMVETPKTIKRGQAVTLVAHTQGMEVRMSGTALTDGVLGELIKVRNLSSRRVVEGEVIGPGTIRVWL